MGTLQGGALLSENLSWGSSLLHTLSQAPDPATVGAHWRDLWLNRLQALHPLTHNWLHHAREDASWAQGSVKGELSSSGGLQVCIPLVGAGKGALSFAGYRPMWLCGESRVRMAVSTHVSVKRCAR